MKYRPFIGMKCRYSAGGIDYRIIKLEGNKAFTVPGNHFMIEADGMLELNKGWIVSKPKPFIILEE